MVKHVAIVAGELSGDRLGADLMVALKARYPGARFEGVGGPEMLREGLAGLYPQERLAVMGLTEVVRHLPGLVAMRRALVHHFRRQPPDVFVGIDSPDFNLGLERRLREAGVPSVHYVSPTVWAWRSGRVRGIARAIDLMLTLYPFEARFYEAENVPVRFVGHPAADRLPLKPETQRYRERLGIPAAAQMIALLPGSRLGEVARMAPIMAAAALTLQRARPGLGFSVAVAGPHLRRPVQQAFAGTGITPRLVEGDSEAVMGAADLVIAKSGTATLEAMLLKRPMVVIYRVSKTTAMLAKRLGMLQTRHFALPNLLADTCLVPELIQEHASPERVADAAIRILDDPDAVAALKGRFTEQHRRLRRGASESAADALSELVHAND